MAETITLILTEDDGEKITVSLNQAETGATGATGAQGDRAGLKYTFSTSTGAGAPSPGYLKFNSATLSAVTQIAIRDTDFDGANTTALLALIDDSTSTMKARVLIRSNSNSDTSNFNFLVTSVTDEGNHFHINGTYVSGSAFADNEVVTFDFYMTGDLGATGPAPSGTGFVKVTGGVLDPASQNLGAAIINANIVPDADSSRSIGSDSIYLDYLYANTILANGITLGYMPTGTVPGSITIYSDTNTNSTSISSASTGSRSISFPDASGTLALTANKLSAFAATTSSELRSVISDETGSGSLVFGTSPTLVTPALGTPASGDLSNCTGFPERISYGINNSLSAANNGFWFGTASTVALPRITVDYLPKKIAAKVIIAFASTPAAAGTSNFELNVEVVDPASANLSIPTVLVIPVTSVTKVSGREHYILTGEISEAAILSAIGTNFSTFGFLTFIWICYIKNKTGATLVTSSAAGGGGVEIWKNI